MKTIAIFVGFLAVAYAGVGIPGPQEIQEAMALWQRHCSGASEGGTDGQTYIFCKRSKDGPITREAQHELNVTPGPAAPRQVIFVQPPSYNYQHRVVLKGGPSSAQQTRIYVLPPKVNHQVQYDDTRPTGTPAGKPQLFFLPDQTFGGGGGDSGPVHGGNYPDQRGNLQVQVQPFASANTGAVQTGQSGFNAGISVGGFRAQGQVGGQPQQQGNAPIASVLAPPHNYRVAPRAQPIIAPQFHRG